MSAPSGFSWKAWFQGAFRACKAMSSAQPKDIPNYIDFCDGFHHCFNGLWFPMADIDLHKHRMKVHCYRLRLRSSPVGAAIRTGSLLLVRIRSLWRRWTPHSSLLGSTSITSSSLERAAVAMRRRRVRIAAPIGDERRRSR